MILRNILIYITLTLLAVPVLACPDVPADPFSVAVQPSINNYTHQTSIQTYYQSNKLNRHNLFNPGLTRFENHQQVSVFDWEVKSQWKNNFQLRSRAITQYQKSNLNDDSNANLLEAYIDWHSDDFAWQGQLGRVHTQWSSGFNWHLMNVLSPVRNRPYIDVDNPNQQKGWDMLNVKYQHDKWFYQIAIIDYVTKSKSHKPQYVARFGYQGLHDFSLLVHKLPEQTASVAASYNQLVSDNITLRAQWSQSAVREQETPILIGNIENKRYQKFLLGAGYTLNSGHDFRVEYLNSQHGFTKQQWSQIIDKSEIANEKIIKNQANNSDYIYLAAGLSSLGRGQLRQNYLYLSYTSPLSSQLWQYLQSIQVNLDDDSQLHRLAILKSWNNNLTSRLQIEAFNGCAQCEYGLTPNKYNVRFVLNWAF